ncbi:hypothetical protein ACET3Z_025293 [Daucus carota]
MASGGVKVLGSNYSPFVNRVQIALNLKSVEFEFIHENLNPKSELLLKSNPVHKKIPVLIHGDKCICESSVIVQYIDEAWTGNGHSILPSDPYDRAVARFWAAYYDDKLSPMMKELRSVKEEERAALVERIDEGLGLLEEAFVKCSKGKAYFGGDHIGYIDIVIGSSFGWITAMEKMSGKKLIEEAKTPGLFGWVDKFLSNDAVKDVIPTTEMFLQLLAKMQAKPAAS